MKRIFAIALLAGAACLSPQPRAFAQQQQQARPGGMFGQVSVLQMTPPLQAKLKLTEEQKSKVDGLRKKLQETRMAAVQEAQNGGDQMAAFQKVAAAQRASETEAEALLTEEQKKNLAGMKEQAMQLRGLGRSAVGLLGVDGLTDDQKAKLKALSDDSAAKARELFQSAAQGGDRQAAVQKLLAMQAESETAVKKLLTADQAKQFEAALPAQMRRPGAGNNQ